MIKALFNNGLKFKYYPLRNYDLNQNNKDLISCLVVPNSSDLSHNINDCNPNYPIFSDVQELIRLINKQKSKKSEVKND
jgi:hypothetical protein